MGTSFHGHRTELFLLVDQVSVIITTIVIMMGSIHLFLHIGILFVEQINVISSTSLKKKRFLLNNNLIGIISQYVKIKI